MTIPVIYRWRITLRCGCVYRIESDPDLTRPMICGVVECVGCGYRPDTITKAAQ